MTVTGIEIVASGGDGIYASSRVTVRNTTIDGSDYAVRSAFGSISVADSVISNVGTAVRSSERADVTDTQVFGCTGGDQPACMP